MYALEGYVSKVSVYYEDIMEFENESAKPGNELAWKIQKQG